MNPIIRTERLTKTYRHPFERGGPVEALRGVTLEVKRNEICAVLGLNGAGKTTLIKLLLGLVRPTSGSAFLFGEPVSTGRWKGKVGYLPELFSVSEHLNARQVLNYLGSLGGLRGRELVMRVSRVLEMVGLKGSDTRGAGTYSKGMLLRLGLAQSLLMEPPLLILDEPTDGLDPIGKKQIRDMLVQLRASGVSILLNSHVLSDVELLADSIAILKDGTLVMQGPVENFMPDDGQFTVLVSEKPELSAPWELRPGEQCWSVLARGSSELQALLCQMQNQGIHVNSITPHRRTLEEAFSEFIVRGDDD